MVSMDTLSEDQVVCASQADCVAEINDENVVSMATLSKDQVVCASQADCVEEKQKKKKSKKSKKEKSSNEEKEAVEDSGCEEVAEVKVKKTKKSKKEKTKSEEGADSSPKVKNDTSKKENPMRLPKRRKRSPRKGNLWRRRNQLFRQLQ